VEVLVRFDSCLLSSLPHVRRIPSGTPPEPPASLANVAVCSLKVDLSPELTLFLGNPLNVCVNILSTYLRMDNTHDGTNSFWFEFDSMKTDFLL
jgi:hypothetical protein